MLYLTEAELGHVLRIDDAVRCIEAALVAHARGDAIDVARARTRVPAGQLSILQGAAPGIDVVGYKAYYSTRAGTSSHVFLYDLGGKPLAMLEANAFNVVRTGAASAVATRYLARADATVVGQIGAGRQGAGQLEAVCEVRPIKRASVYARDRERLQAFCAHMSAGLGIPVEPAPSAQSAVRHADVINLITKSSAPVLFGDWLEPGQHVNAAGSNALSRVEIDLTATRRFDRIAVDARATAMLECGDLLALVESGAVQWQQLPEIGEIAAGLRPGRQTATEITLYESHGMALQDIYFAAYLVERARALELGSEVGSY